MLRSPMARIRLDRWMPRTVGAVLRLLVSTQHSALSTAQDDDRFGQPETGYYGAYGSGVTAAWSLDRTTVPEDGVIVATLTVTGATNPQKIVRPDLKQLPAFQDRFTITDN